MRVKDLRRVAALYDSPTQDYQPYTWCAFAVFLRLWEWAKRNIRPTDRITVCYEKGDKHQSQFRAELEELFSVTPQFLSKGDCVPFQAADMVAWFAPRFG